MARNSYYVETVDGQKVPFDVPEGATADQVQTLAARALKRAAPEKQYDRPVLSKDTYQSLLPESARGELKANDTATARIEGDIQGILSGVGVNERYASHLANRTTSALNDLTAVGGGVMLSDAADDFQAGHYLSALGKGALGALSTVPGVGGAIGGVGKAMFLGALAKNADKAALSKAEQMLAAGADRRQIWDETGWFQGADSKWRFEVPDNEMTLDPRQFPNPHYQARRAANEFTRKHYGADTFNHLPQGSPERGAAMSVYSDKLKEFGSDMKVRADDIIQHPELFEAYPSARDIQVGQVNALGLRGSWQDDAGILRLANDAMPSESRSTAAHELQHFVQGQEGFARGGMVGAIPARDVDPSIAKLEEEIAAMEALPRGDPGRENLLFKKNLLRLAEQNSSFEGYRRLAGEVEARNVQTRLDMTPGQRREYAPWETEDVPREDQFVIWHGDQPQGALGQAVKVDNPGGDWLASKQRWAAEDKLKGRNATGPITAWTPGPVELPLSSLSGIPGARGEIRRPGEAQYDDLLADVNANGFRDDAPILVGVDYSGRPYIIEGNTRVAVANAIGRETIPAEVRWYAGGEQAGSVHPRFTIEEINRILGGQ